ncbi:DUF4105 domain-containing protein [Alloalcanivorax gelatiniphagus]|uniref:DUF4105 domain-containing protein n=1 Tax=Alloalcanivorax gelatiniphagus TaxID=1194167 RepID=A0ABY2XIZ4_9GAMM|nr:DUF4105 domain-containing protein [Alloalcanivorax gelatiniphagus]TMW11867.1 DUF4105 domain-containing protein [Alloalcanivorax gelatiniphagus]|tara:strand:- start:3601 stop:5415 length:1815 start_codon:yes stop_codon:yes gene_type:complete
MRFALLCVVALFCVPAWAGDLDALAEQPRWRALLHINPGATLRDRQRSYVDDDNFFLAERGADDPLAELRATVLALRPDHAPARCRFPARYRFLAEQLNWRDDTPFAHCADYLEWRAAVHAKRAVLVFPASYLNSPSSMFGHTLMRLDQGDDSAVWLSWAINFGAVTTEQDNSLFYIYRGLAGGYPGRFNLVPYVQKIQQYSNMESRDIWEYSLDLNQGEIDWMIDHLWELKDINFDYYFFDENCSFRLLELVQVARPEGGLLDELRFAELPVNTVRALDQEGLITERHYRPSKEQELTAFSDQLSSEERALARGLADDPARSEEPAFQAYPPRRQALMAHTAYRYVRFVNRKAQRSEDVAGRSFALLSLINRLPAVQDPAPVERVPPEQGHGSQMLAVAGGQRGSDDFGEFSYRLTYHDLLDNNRGFLSGAQIQGLGITLRSTESQAVDLEALDVVSIRSLAPRDRFSKPLSWYVEGGLERAWAERRRLVRYVQGGAGASWRLGNLQPYLLASARAENNSDFAPWITTGGGAEAGLLYHAGRWQWQAGGAGHYFVNDVYRYRSTLAVQYALTGQQGLRAEVEREGWRGDGETEFKLQWRWYFD